MPEHLSWSSVDTMLACPKKYELRKVVRVEERPSYAAIGGIAVHRATERVDKALSEVLLTCAQEGTK